MEKVALILLAAGGSRRFGANKLLHMIQGKPMYRCLTEELETLPSGFFCKKIVVTRYGEIAGDLRKLGYETVENRQSELGISHSIRLGLGAVREPEASFCFAVCDQPYLRAASVRALIEGWEGSGKGIGCLCFEKEPGNPVVFSRKYREELMALQGDVGGKRLVRSHMEDVYLCGIADGRELSDIDFLE